MIGSNDGDFRTWTIPPLGLNFIYKGRGSGHRRA